MTNTALGQTETAMPNTHSHAPQNTPPQKRKLWIWRFLILILPLLVILLSIAAFVAMGALKPKPETKEDPIKAVPVLTATAVQDDVTLSITTQGEVQPRTQIRIVPQVSGQISYMSPNFIEGGAFRKGDVLARIQSRDFELRVVQARANVAQAETALTREKTESEIALSDWKDINGDNAGAPSALTLREPQMAEAAARLASAQAQLDEAQLMLSRTSIKAPFSGRVVSRSLNQGEFITTGTALGEVYSSDIMDVRLPLTQDELRRAGLTPGINPATSGEPIAVDLSANMGGTTAHWTGTLTRIDNRFDAQTRVIYAYAEVRDPFGKGAFARDGQVGVPMVPGLFVTAKINGQSFDNTIVIPRAALRGNDQVYVANDDETLAIKTVSVISSDRDRAVLRGGLAIGDAVVTSPIRGVSEGMKIAVVTSEAQLGISVTQDEPTETDDAEVSP